MNLSHYLVSESFYAKVKQRLRVAKPDFFALVSMDFDNFNYINDLFGYSVGDTLLDRLALRFDRFLGPGEFFSRLHADHFVFWMATGGTADLTVRLEQMMQHKEDLQDLLPPHYSLVSSSGVLHVSDPHESLSSLLDKANFARKRTKGTSVSTFLCYDQPLAEELSWRKAITFTMESALQHREFEMYLQPKILMKSGQVAGAEALVRWNSPRYGMVCPDRFIPILEQNGFVCRVDFFMLEETCRFLTSCTEQALLLLPISVNFSKAHLRSPGFADRVYQTVSRFGIPPELIEIELTENIYLEDSMTLVDVTCALKQRGFRVSLDDFGSAYSSLGCLKDLPVDTIKIDKGFLKASSDSDKGRIIISKMVELIKSLRIISVMEGVETAEQVEFLQKLSCDLGQGYYYARPMPIPDYIKFLSDNTMDSVAHGCAPLASAIHAPYSAVVPQEFQMNSWELYTLGQNIDMGLMKGFLGTDATVQYVNDRALEYIGYTREEFYSLLHNKLSAFAHPDDLPLIIKHTEQLVRTGQPQSFRTRAIRRDGKVIILQGRSSCVMDHHGQAIGIYAFQDITEELEQTEGLQCSLEEKIVRLEALVSSERQNREALRLSEERYRLIVEQSNDIVFDWDFATDSIQFSDKYQALFQRAPVTQSFSINPEVRLHICAEDHPIFETWVCAVFCHTDCVQAEFRFLTELGSRIWMRCRATPILDESGTPIRAVGVFSNIDQLKTQMNALVRKSQTDPLTHLLNKEETRLRVEAALTRYPERPASFFIIDVDNFKGLNDSLGHQMGDMVLTEVSGKIRRIFRDSDVVGRIGGDEIAVFSHGLTDKTTLALKAEQLIRSVRSTYYGATGQYVISGSVGISCYPQDGTCFADLYHLADVALYESKHRGKDRYAIYHELMQLDTPDSLTPVECLEIKV